MPENSDFGFKILVGGIPLKEYQHAADGPCLVECNLSTPVSYQQMTCELINGETESQEWPVTPYEVEVFATPDIQEKTFYFRVFIDGVKIKGISLASGQSRIIKGFRDGTVVRELLFSMPRFAEDESDRISDGRASQIGMISVECWDAMLHSTEWKVRKKNLDFSQANKKDAFQVTNGNYTMTTSKAGRPVKDRSEFRCVDTWKRVTLRSQLDISYRMGYELQELGFQLEPLQLKMSKKTDRDGKVDESWLRNNEIKHRKRHSLRCSISRSEKIRHISGTPVTNCAISSTTGSMKPQAFDKIEITDEKKHECTDIKVEATDIVSARTIEGDDDELIDLTADDEVSEQVEAVMEVEAVAAEEQIRNRVESAIVEEQICNE